MGRNLTMFRTTPWALISYALLCSGPLWAQATNLERDGSLSDISRQEPEELIVRGRRLEDFRFAVEAARVRVYDLFNDLNSDDAFDVHCQEESSSGTRMRQHVCRPQFKDDIANAAATAWAQGIKESCPPHWPTQVCIFSDYASLARSRAQAEEAKAGPMQKRFEQEMARVVSESPELQRAMLDYEAAERGYDEARRAPRGRRCDRPEPPARCSR
jgi:hypothetical protein